MEKRHRVEIRLREVLLTVTCRNGVDALGTTRGNRCSVLTQYVDSALERGWMVERCKLDTVDTLTFLYAEVVHCGFEGTRISETAQFLEVLGTATQLRGTFSKLPIIHSRCALDRVVGTSSLAVHG